MRSEHVSLSDDSSKLSSRLGVNGRRRNIEWYCFRGPSMRSALQVDDQVDAQVASCLLTK